MAKEVNVFNLLIALTDVVHDGIVRTREQKAAEYEARSMVVQQYIRTKRLPFTIHPKQIGDVAQEFATFYF